jgi:hypothetical protein
MSVRTFSVKAAIAFVIGFTAAPPALAWPIAGRGGTADAADQKFRKANQQFMNTEAEYKLIIKKVSELGRRFKKSMALARKYRIGHADIESSFEGAMKEFESAKHDRNIYNMLESQVRLLKIEINLHKRILAH